VARGEQLTIADRLEIVAVRAVAALPRSVKRRIAGEPIRRDGLELDLDMQVLLKLEERNPRPPLSSGSAAEARKNLLQSVRTVEGPPLGIAEVRETTLAGAEGPLPARLYSPHGHQDGAAGALIVYYHGGGWVAGDLDTHDRPCRLLAGASGARVLSVDYRLAPEHPFPAPVDDALAAFRDAVARAEELGADPGRIAVAGDSAGGHLAAVTARQALADEGTTPSFQLLIYPVTDLVHTSASRLMFAEGFVLTKENMDWYEAQLLATGGDREDPRVSPAFGEVHPATAPALVITAGFDPLRDEGEAYAQKLREAGVRTMLRRQDRFVHGFIHALALGSAPRAAVAEMGGVLRAALAR
jgi:acetyl esterase